MDDGPATKRAKRIYQTLSIVPTHGILDLLVQDRRIAAEEAEAIKLTLHESGIFMIKHR